MSRVKKALSCFEKGFNCAQSVLSSFSEDYGLDNKLSLKIASAFGGGIARSGKTCGAISGALMVIGLEHGMADPDDKDSKSKTYQVANDFIKNFIEKNDSTECKFLIGCDISTKEGSDLAHEREVFSKICPNLVKDAVEILERMLR